MDVPIFKRVWSRLYGCKVGVITYTLFLREKFLLESVYMGNLSEVYSANWKSPFDELKLKESLFID